MSEERVIVPATVGVPAMLFAPRDAFVPAVPREEEAPPEAPPIPEPPEPPPVTSMEALQRFVSAQLPLDDETGLPILPDEDEDEPTSRLRSLGPLVDPAVQAGLDDRATFGEALAHDEIIFDRARSCFEDLALLGAMRRPLPDDGWRSRSRAEERLLARVDALAACGSAVYPRLIELHEDRPLPDPDLTWATIFFFGCLGGNDAIEQVSHALAWTDLAAPGMVDCVADALALAPDDRAAALIVPWLEDGDPLRRSVALAALSRRGSLNAGYCVEALADGDPLVVRAGARALLHLGDQVAESHYDRALTHDDETVVRSALEASLRRRYTPGYEHAVALTREGRGAFADAVRFVAAAAPFEHQEVFAQALGGERSAALYEAIGCFGDVEFSDALLRALDAKEPAHKSAAANALQRLSGAGLTKSDADPRYADDDRPFARAWSEPEAVIDLSDDSGAWRAWWTKHAKAASLGTRWRCGRRWNARDELWEMTQPDALRSERVLGACTLAARCNLALPFDVERFIPAQDAQLVAWNAAVEAWGARGEGAWPTRVGGMR